MFNICSIFHNLRLGATQSSTPKGEKLAKLSWFAKILHFPYFLILILTPFCLGNVTMILQLVAIYFLFARQLNYYFGLDLDTLAASRIYLHFHAFTNRHIFQILRTFQILWMTNLMGNYHSMYKIIQKSKRLDYTITQYFFKFFHSVLFLT